MVLVRGGFFQISLMACCVLVCVAQAQVPRPGGSNKEIPILFPRVEQEELFLQSIEAFDAGQTNRMMQLVDQAVAIDPVNGYAYIKRAQLMDLVGNNQRAAADYTSALTYVGTDPKFADIYQMRGCAFFKLGNLRAAVGDWATFLRMKPEKEAEHWQIGVAYALLGSHEEARKQLEWHWTVNSGDMEVAFWHYLSVARMEGVDQARAALREIDGEERVPMNKLYELYQGKATEGDVWLAVAEGNPDAAEQTRRKFFAHLYLGLRKQAAGQLTAAKAEIRKALDIALVNEGYIGDSPGGQLRGGDIARVHHQQLQRMIAEQQAWLEAGQPKDSAGTFVAYGVAMAGLGGLIVWGLRAQRRRSPGEDAAFEADEPSPEPEPVEDTAPEPELAGKS